MVQRSRDKPGGTSRSNVRSTGARTRKRDPIQTQEKILAAAEAEFARKGYDGARVDAIVRRAKVSKNLVYHHFKDKEDLYVRVLERTYGKLRRRQNDVSLVGVDPVEGMRRLCESTFQTFVDEPDIIIMLNTENLHRGKHLGKSTIIRALYNPLMSAIEALLKDGEARGVFRKGVDPVELYISVSALGYFYLSNRHTLSLIFDRKLIEPRELERRKQHVVDVVLSYLTATTNGGWQSAP